MADIELPPLPPCTKTPAWSGFTADDMLDYARATAQPLADRVQALQAELAGLRADAGRYRWLRDGAPMHSWPPIVFPTPPWTVRCELDRNMPSVKPVWGIELDAAIDAAIAETGDVGRGAGVKT